MSSISELINLPIDAAALFEGLEAEWKRQGLLPDPRRSQFTIKYYDHPSAFIHDMFDWKDDQGSTFYQDEVVDHIPGSRRVSVRGPHGLGKTALAAWVILWFAITREVAKVDWKVPTTASAWRQLEKFLWPEIHKWSRKLRWDLIPMEPLRDGMTLLDLSIKLQHGEAFALASDNSAMIEGAHADELLYVFDESKEIKPETWDSAEGAFSTGKCFWLAISTPGEPGGRFYEIQSRRPGYEDWWVRHVRLEETIKAKRISPDWAAARAKQWGKSSAVYQNRVEGEFATSDEDGVIPLSLIEKANERWYAWMDAGGLVGRHFQSLGVDVARSGADKTVKAPRIDNAIVELRRTSKHDTMETAGEVKGILDAHPGCIAIIDVIGIGAGVVDRLREQSYDVVAFNASEHTDKTDESGELGFVNLRSAALWNLREMLMADDSDVCLPPDDLLTGDLTSPHWKTMSGGKIQVESKDDIKERLGRSTDDGDAVVMAFWKKGAQSAGSWIRALQSEAEAGVIQALVLPEGATWEGSRRMG